MEAVSDSGPLIWLTKIGMLPLLGKLYSVVLIPPEVYGEVVERGFEEGFSDALIVKEAVDEGWVRVEELSEGEREAAKALAEKAYELHLGEAQATALAKERSAMLLMDESSGRALAESWGVKVKGTLYIVFRGLREGCICGSGAKEALSSLIYKGFRIDPGLVTRVLKEIDLFQG